MINFSEFYLNEKLIQDTSWLGVIRNVLSNHKEGLQASEIWEVIKKNNLIETKAKDPLNNNIYPLLQRHTDNIYDKRSGIPYFTSYGIPRIFKLKESDVSNEKELEITNNNQIFDEIKKASTDIYNCLTSTSYLCNKLNKIDKEYFKEYLDFPKVGPVNDIRRDVATYLVDNNITPAILDEIIKKHKKEKPNQLRAWLNPYKILHTFINQEYKHFDEEVEKFTKEISNTLGVKYKINNFNGSQQQGSEKFWIALYNKELEHQSRSLQLFINFEQGVCKYGIYKHNGAEYLVGPETYTNWESFSSFISENIHYILEDKKSEDTTEIPTDLDESEVTNVYCVRGGRGNSDANLFLEGNFVGIGYYTKGFDIGSKTKEEINEFLLIKYENSKTSVPQYLQQIVLFSFAWLCL